MTSPRPPRSAATPRKFILRPYRRIPTWLGFDYMSRDAVGHGVVSNLSCSGMRATGNHSLSPGAQLALRVNLQEGRPPIEIARATVRWVDQYDFGVAFERLDTSAVRRITALLNHQARTTGLSS
ncbi:MAG TPA: PilZ domain-containing protein [Nitrospira sp.]|nr:PilZ domain-containing protein [Nitrospira sp.]